jgi:hypothetical protein
MTRGKLVACALVLALGMPGLAGAGEVRLSIKDGRVTLVARDATLRDILVEWERVGGTRIVNRDRVPATRLTLELPNATEEQALTTLLRSIAGYIASRRTDPAGGASAFSRLVLLTAPATPSGYAASVSSPPAGSPGAVTPSGPPFGRPGMQRRVLPDGRVVTVMDDSAGAGAPAEPDEPPRDGAPGMMRPPFNAPRPEGQAGDDAPQQTLQPGQAVPTTASVPTVPTTVGTPGQAVPAAKPGMTPPPIKPPGD